MSQNPKEVADWSQNRKRYTYVARKQKKMAARWDRHGRKSLSAQSVKEIGREKRKRSDEAIQKCYLKVKDKKRRTSGNRTKMKSWRNQEQMAYPPTHNHHHATLPGKIKQCRMERCEGVLTSAAGWTSCRGSVCRRAVRTQKPAPAFDLLNDGLTPGSQII